MKVHFIILLIHLQFMNYRWLVVTGCYLLFALNVQTWDHHFKEPYIIMYYGYSSLTIMSITYYSLAISVPVVYLKGYWMLL